MYIKGGIASFFIFLFSDDTTKIELRGILRVRRHEGICIKC